MSLCICIRHIGVVFAAVCVACSSIRTVDLGYALSPATGGQQLMARARTATGSGHVLVGAEARARVGPAAQQAGVGPGALYQPFRVGMPVIPHLGGGVFLLELGRVDDAFEIGVGDPWIELGMTWMIENKTAISECGLRIWAMPPDVPRAFRQSQEGWGLTLASGVQYDVRFTGQPNDLIWVVTLGAAQVARYGSCHEQEPFRFLPQPMPR